jgi:hypothetical protein
MAPQTSEEGQPRIGEAPSREKIESELFSRRKLTCYLYQQPQWSLGKGVHVRLLMLIECCGSKERGHGKPL